LHEISPIDGRYQKICQPLREFFSEFALTKFRVFVEIEYFLQLAQENFFSLSHDEKEKIKIIFLNFSEKDFENIKNLEKETNHDVKSVEYFLKNKFSKISENVKENLEFIHFGLTSEDINNLAYALMVKNSIKKIFFPELKKLQQTILQKVEQWKSVAMLSWTHGQPATPTTMGKEWLIFYRRIERQLQQLENQEFLGKLAGASGNFSAHHFAFPDFDWLNFSKKFVEKLELICNPIVSQIEPHDFIAEISHLFFRISTILIDFSRDSWGYISRGFFQQISKKNEVGSSAMPHKINPIDFENAEGNLGLSRSLFLHFSEKLPISRFQRDLSDSTVFRNLGVSFSHFFLGIKSVLRGISKIEINSEKISSDLSSHPEILAEAVQTILRKNKIAGGYELLKKFSRGKNFSKQELQIFSSDLLISEIDKKKLIDLSPEKYIGLAEKIIEKFS